jgi:isopentenyl-diphosphate delta-isomerase
VGEELSAAVERRMEEELGLPRGCLSAENGNRVPIEIGKFRYRCDFGGVIENEIDHVFILAADRARLDLRPDPAEIAELRWYAIGEIDRLLAVTPEKFTVWFPKAYSIARDYVHGK